MPITTNWGFEYESPSSLPGITLTGGPGGGSPILAVQIDTALNTVSGRIDTVETDITGLEADVADLENDITAGQTSITNLTNWSRRGSVGISFTSQSSSTVGVSFGFTFPAPPTVMTNIHTGVGAAARWISRAINTTTTGFDMFVHSADATTDTWSSVDVTYIALYRA